MIMFTTSTMMILAITLVGILLVKKLLTILTGPKLPPGPTPLPFIGNIYQLGSRPQHPHITFNELAERYGDIMTVRAFNTKFVILNSYEIIKEVLYAYSDTFSERPITFLLKMISDGGKGLIWQEGSMWKGIKKTTYASLRDFGLDKKSMEHKTLEEARGLADVIAENNGNPFDPAPCVTRAIGNIIISVLFGSRFEQRDKQFLILVDRIVETMAMIQPIEPIEHAPLIQWLPLPQRVKKLLVNIRDINEIIHSQIEEHRVTFNKNNPRDFIDLYLVKEGEDKAENELFSVVNIKNVIQDLLFTGFDPTAKTILWAIVYMVHYPDIQLCLDKEMTQVVGNERQPVLADKANLDYLQAFIMETLRHASVLPLSFSRLCSADTQIGGYTIPKGTTVLANIYHVHMSERYWKNPAQFNPDRFLDDNGRVMTTMDGFLPFGAGPRTCIGESMGRTNLFLILACLIQRFTFKPEDEDKLPPLLGKSGILLGPDPFMIRAIPK